MFRKNGRHASSRELLLKRSEWVSWLPWRRTPVKMFFTFFIWSEDNAKINIYSCLSAPPERKDQKTRRSIQIHFLAASSCLQDYWFLRGKNWWKSADCDWLITDAQLLKLDWNAVSVWKSTVFWGVCNTLLIHCGQKSIVNHLNYGVFLPYYDFFLPNGENTQHPQLACYRTIYSSFGRLPSTLTENMPVQSGHVVLYLTSWRRCVNGRGYML